MLDLFTRGVFLSENRIYSPIALQPLTIIVTRKKAKIVPNRSVTESSPMRILIIGGSGQLGQDLLHQLVGHDIQAPDHTCLDVTDEPGLAHAISDLRPAVVINTSAFHDVPRCEAEPETAFRVNALGPLYLARACRMAQAKLFHISTDYVFDGRKGTPYNEADPPGPLNVYGTTKLAGEHLARASHSGTWIIRTTGLFGKNPCRGKPGGRNFVETMLYLAAKGEPINVVADQRCCPTFTVDLAQQIRALLESKAPAGIYHAVNSPGCSWYEFSQIIFELAGLQVQLQPVTSDRFPGPARRPADSRIEPLALREAGIYQMRTPREALASFLSDNL